MTLSKNSELNQKRIKKQSRKKTHYEEIDLSRSEKVDDGPHFVTQADDSEVILTGEDAKNFLRLLGEKTE